TWSDVLEPESDGGWLLRVWTHLGRAAFIRQGKRRRLMRISLVRHRFLSSPRSRGRGEKDADQPCARVELRDRHPAVSRPVNRLVLERNRSFSTPSRCSIDTKRLHSGGGLV